MQTGMRSLLAAAALLGSVGYASAQVSTTIELSPEQRTTIYRDVTRERVRVAPPADFRFSRGIEVPAVRRYRYTVIDNQVVLVDPRTRRIVEIIRE